MGRSNIRATNAMSSYLTLNELTELPHDAAAFAEFFEARRRTVGARIRRKLSSGIIASVVVAEEPEA